MARVVQGSRQGNGRAALTALYWALAIAFVGLVFLAAWLDWLQSKDIDHDGP